jgi:hypothetical protein
MTHVEAKASDPGLIRWAGPMTIGRAVRRAPSIPLFFAYEMWGRIREAMVGRRGGVAVIIRRQP